MPTETFAPVRQELLFICIKCTRWQQFMAETEQAALEMADRAGWKATERGPVCGKCPS